MAKFCRYHGQKELLGEIVDERAGYLMVRRPPGKDNRERPLLPVRSFEVEIYEGVVWPNDGQTI